MATTSHIGLFKREDFQRFCSVLLCAEDPEFRAIRGDGGDQGSDGFTAQSSVVYQAYAPEKVILQKLKDKIDDSLTKAVSLKNGSHRALTTLRLLTPFDLTLKQQQYLEEAAKRLGLKAEAWGESQLLAILARHPQIRVEFPELLLPDLAAQMRRISERLDKGAVDVDADSVLDGPNPNDDFAEFRPGAIFPDIYVLQRKDGAQSNSDNHRAYAFWRAWVHSPALSLESMEPSNEDEFLYPLHRPRSGELPVAPAESRA